MRQIVVGVAVILLSIGAFGARKKVDFECPNDNDVDYEHPVHCDKYYRCIGGRATEEFCPDGLVFDSMERLSNKCVPVFNVDCGDRDKLQDAQGKGNCPRKNGSFAHPDPTICDIFYNCENGNANEVKCTGGLHFNEYTGNCEWPNSAGREGCATAAQKKDMMNRDGEFVCPNDSTKRFNTSGQEVAHPTFPHDKECSKFFICINGAEKREAQCEKGKVFNGATGACDAPDRVPGCEDWYTKSKSKSVN